MPKSLVKDALGKDIPEVMEKSSPQPAAQVQATPPAPSTADDEEIRKIAAQLDVSIKIIGCGGGGSNTINRCVEAGITGAQLCAINTDAKHLLAIHAPKKILIGKNITRGLGAGAIPQVGEAAAKENEREIRDFIQGANIVFVTAGMGGGTGTGSAHFAARLAKEQKALTIGVVTLPFKAEGDVRMENALDGLERLRRLCDTTIVIPNDKLLELVPKLPVDAAFKVADEVLMQTIRGLTEIITKPGLVNLDYSDILTVMNEGGVAFVGIGESEEADPEDRVEAAIEEALNSPLLGEIELKDSKGALIRVVGGPDMTVSEAQKAAEIVGQRIAKHARLIWGCSIDPSVESTVKILLIVTGARSDAFLSQSATASPTAVSKRAPSGGSRSYGRDDEPIDFVR
ncbi:MAG: cell division protein FtsZ [Thermoplasmata archaeon]|jgi:cell division protein FtsZ